MELERFIEQNAALQLQLLTELCAIPAPSGMEKTRAEYILKTFEKWGIAGAYADDADNVILPLGNTEGNALSVLAAHTDTVFPDLAPFSVFEADGKLFCPGIGDDTVCCVQLMLAAKYLFENGYSPENGLLIVFDSGEEGLGNLRGTRRLFETFAGRIKRFVTFDHGVPGAMVTKCVGSERYRVSVKTAGGHSYTAFGNENAVARLSAIINEIYRTEVPAGGKTTYNVGVVSGGTSVNTIAENAEMLCEYRSDDAKSLETMRAHFARIFENARRPGVEVSVEPVGERPCAKGVDETAQQKLEQACAKILKQWTGNEPACVSGSTDCNIPQSLGITAVCVPVYSGAASHTREEYIEKNSLLPGLAAAIRFAVLLAE